MTDYRKEYNALKELNDSQEKLLQEQNAEIKRLKVNCDRLRENNEE